jgi:uncharacterized surface protein with fasciclin (FAS1) repeats
MRRRAFLAGAALSLPMSRAATVGEAKDLADTVQSAGMFTTLLATLETAGLVDTLRGSGPITLFAPTDEAFGKLPKGLLEDLLRPENRVELRSILLYQMVSGRYSMKDIRYMYSVPTVQGQKVSLHYFQNGMRVDNAKVLSAVPAANGVMHAIDSVIMPYKPVLSDR